MSTVNRLEGKVCLIVGASSGMGRQTALAAGDQGALTLVAARRKDACEEVAVQIRSTGGTAEAIGLDATDEHAVDAVFDDIQNRFGRLDGAFNNLGAILGDAPIDETPIARWRDSLDTNLTSIFMLMRREIPLMKAAGGGAIVNNSSSAGLRGERRMSDYCAAKWGLIGLTKTAALEYGPDNIRVNAIAPGVIMTEKAEEIATQAPALFDKLRARIPLEDFGAMTDIADLTTWLMSEEARYISGVTLPIDGAQTAGAPPLM